MQYTTQETHRPARGSNYQLTWYEGKRKKCCNVGRFVDAAQIAQINKEAELRKATFTATVLATVPTEPEIKSEPETEGRDFTASLTQYLKEVRVGKSKKTYLAYSVTLNAFAKVCKATTVEEMTRQHVLGYKQVMKNADLSPRTVANRFSFLRTFFLHLDLAWPMKKTDRVRYTEKTVEAYSNEQLDALFEAADEEESELFQFFLCTGVREQEAMYATFQDVDYPWEDVQGR